MAPPVSGPSVSIVALPAGPVKGGPSGTLLIYWNETETAPHPSLPTLRQTPLRLLHPAASTLCTNRSRLPIPQPNV
ncbi:unnamed protein product [Arctogadus glacialis]